jgi:hypothetical protein
MARKAFYSFHYKPDHWRASQVRNMGVIEGNADVSDNDWESITGGGDGAVQTWIADQMQGKSCAIVLVGENTAGRKWITYEINKAWNDRKGVVGIRIHKLKNANQVPSLAGQSPFDYVQFTQTGKSLSSVVKLYDPYGATSTEVYKSIKDNIANWVEEAIAIRG